jgi:hypothetical protein
VENELLKTPFDQPTPFALANTHIQHELAEMAPQSIPSKLVRASAQL